MQRSSGFSLKLRRPARQKLTSATSWRTGRRAFLVAVMTTAALGLRWGPTADAREDETRHWIGTWAAAPAGVAGTPSQFNNRTLRLIVRTSAAGERVRVRISNTFGAEPLVIGAAHIARRAAGASVILDTDRTLTFSGNPSFTVPAGALVLSDPVDLDLPALSDLAVSIYLPGMTPEATTHATALQTNYVSPVGDFTGAVEFPIDRTLNRWPFLTGVAVSARKQAATIVALGDSITDGSNSTPNANRRWPNLLAARLQERRDLGHLGVLDEGIGGNRILHPTETQLGNLFGPAGLARFDRDVLAQAGVKYVIVLLGINDIGHPGANAPPSEEVSAEEIIGGYRQFIERAHEKRITIYGATLTPFENTTIPGFYSIEKEQKRQAVNQWIRVSGAFDAVIDFDHALRDPARPARMLPAYDSGDHLHPNDAGMAAMANAIPLDLFKAGKRTDEADVERGSGVSGVSAPPRLAWSGSVVRSFRQCTAVPVVAAAPGPRRTFPGRAFVALPFSITGTPFTRTYSIPTDSRFGCSNVASS